MDIKPPNLVGAAKAYWNSNTRVNVPVTVIGANGEFYAVERDGHVYVVPKANITTWKKVITPPETTAPKPEEVYWITLTSKELSNLLEYRDIYYLEGDPWRNVLQDLVGQRHGGSYTYEWFSLSASAARTVLDRYGYEYHKREKGIDGILPSGPSFKSVARQLWEEQLRRDGITPR